MDRCLSGNRSVCWTSCCHDCGSMIMNDNIVKHILILTEWMRYVSLNIDFLGHLESRRYIKSMGVSGKWKETQLV